MYGTNYTRVVYQLHLVHYISGMFIRTSVQVELTMTDKANWNQSLIKNFAIQTVTSNFFADLSALKIKILGTQEVLVVV